MVSDLNNLYEILSLNLITVNNTQKKKSKEENEKEIKKEGVFENLNIHEKKTIEG